MKKKMKDKTTLQGLVGIGKPLDIRSKEARTAKGFEGVKGWKREAVGNIEKEEEMKGYDEILEETRQEVNNLIYKHDLFHKGFIDLAQDLLAIDKKIAFFRQGRAIEAEKNEALCLGDMGFNFPQFDSILCDPLLKEHFVYDEKVKPKKVLLCNHQGMVSNIGDYSLIVEKFMPPNSALFLFKKKVVGVYREGSVVTSKKLIEEQEKQFAEIMKFNIRKSNREKI